LRFEQKQGVKHGQEGKKSSQENQESREEGQEVREEILLLPLIVRIQLRRLGKFNLRS